MRETPFLSLRLDISLLTVESKSSLKPIGVWFQAEMRHEHELHNYIVH